MPSNNNAGGKRQGAGNKTKAPINNESTDLVAASPATQMQRIDTRDFDDLDNEKKFAAMLYARGKSKRKIAAELHRTPGTIQRWFNEPRIHQLANLIQDKLANEPVFAIAPMVPKALATIEDMLEQRQNLNVALNAADSVLDRHWGKAIVRQMSQSVAKVDIHIHDEATDASSFIEQDA